MMNLKLQNAAQRRFVVFECYIVKLLNCFYALRDFLYVFGLFMNNNYGMFTFQDESAELHQLLKS